MRVDKIFLVSSILLFIFELALFFFADQSVAMHVVEPDHTHAALIFREIEIPEIAGSQWAKPKSQSTGPDWVFEIFTSPKIDLDLETQALTLPQKGSELWYEQIRDQLSLRSIYKRPYRLQFKGYQGAEGQYTILLENRERDSWILAKVGEKNKDADFTILSFSIHQIPNDVMDPDSTPSFVEDLEMRLMDHRSGEELVFTNQIKMEKDSLVLLVDQEGREFELGENSTFSFSGLHGKLLKIDAVDECVEVRFNRIEFPEDSHILCLGLNTVN